MYDIPFISMTALRSIKSCRSSTLDSVIAAANPNVDVTANDARIRERDESRQDQHLIDTDKLNSVTDYKWIVLYFTS